MLEKIYFAFIRPIFEYGCVVWDKSPRHDILFNEMEKIQLQAARIVTCTNNYSSKHLLYIETGWVELSKRREKQRLILLFKIINGMAPMHLLNTYNNSNNASYDYNLRNNKMQLIYTRTESIRSSFLPASFRLWNELEPSVRNASSLSEFKSSSCKKSYKKNHYYDYGNRKILSSIRMQCSKLNHDLTVNNIIDNELCNCGRTEAASHYFLECPLYIVQRNQLMLETIFLPSLNIILNGDERIDTQGNIELHGAVSKYITQTNRF